ncbi:MAG: Lpg1974 family pore-forming outer membrane protein [Gammaproteobacteria bacterium]
MKRLAVALAAVGLTASLGAYAAMPTGAQATEVNVPQDQGGFYVGASALYWQPTVSGNDLDYAVSQSFGPGNNTNQQINNIDPNYDWGFNVFAGYNFGNGNDVMLEYLRIHTNDSTTTNAPGGGNVIPAHYFANNSSLFFLNDVSVTANQDNLDSYQRAYGKAEVNLDQGDLTVGQYLNIGCADQLRLFAGLRYAKLERELTANYSQNPNNAGDTNLGTGVTATSVSSGLMTALVDDTTVTFFNTVNTSHGALQAYDDSDFKGIGPLIGLSNSYYLGYGIGFIAGLDTGLLIGDVDDSLTLTNYQAGVSNFSTIVAPSSAAGVVFTSSTGSGQNITVTTINTDDARRVVPVVDAKLGFDYTYPFQNYGSLTLEAGWNVSHYWNAVDGIDGGASDANLNSISATPALNNLVLVNGITRATPGHRTNSVGYQGPYVTLTYRATPTA